MIYFADMFCGGGLGARGAVMAGCAPVLAIDSWSTATATYQDNFSGAKVLNSGVELLNPKRLIGKQKIDLLLTSPECTSHSPAKGARKGSEESRKTALTALVWAEAIRPRWIVLENVPHIRGWRRYAELIEGLGELGYGLRETIVDASEFGVPQSRRRLFITCELDNMPAPIRRRSRGIRTARSILDPRDIWDTTPLYAKKRAKPTIQRAEAAIEALGSKSSFLLVYYGSDGGGGWQSLDDPLRTVTTLDRFALVEKINGKHQMRMLQPNELARAMGLPNDHKFNHGTRRDKVKLCGNGICAPVMRTVVSSLIPAKFRNKNRRKD